MFVVQSKLRTRTSYPLGIKREASHIDFANKNVWVGRAGKGGGWGEGGRASVTFLCDTSWEKSIFLFKNFGLFGNIMETEI